MSFFFITASLAAVVIYILWVLFKPKKKHIKKKVASRKKPALKKSATVKKQKALESQIRKKREEQMKKDPEAISRVVRLWLNEK